MAAPAELVPWTLDQAAITPIVMIQAGGTIVICKFRRVRSLFATALYVMLSVGRRRNVGGDLAGYFFRWKL